MRLVWGRLEQMDMWGGSPAHWMRGRPGRTPLRLLLPYAFLLSLALAAAPVPSEADDFENYDCLDCHEGEDEEEVDEDAEPMRILCYELGKTIASKK